MNQGWTPIFGTLVTSTIWGESKDVKILFVTMLALKDSEGVVRGTAEGLRRIADLTLEETLEALRVLESPDTKSTREQEFDGRRIRRVEDGWLILNHFK